MDDTAQLYLRFCHNLGICRYAKEKARSSVVLMPIIRWVSPSSLLSALLGSRISVASLARGVPGLSRASRFRDYAEGGSSASRHGPPDPALLPHLMPNNPHACSPKYLNARQPSIMEALECLAAGRYAARVNGVYWFEGDRDGEPAELVTIGRLMLGVGKRMVPLYGSE